MGTYNWSVKSKIDLKRKGYGKIEAPDDATAGSLVPVLNAYCCEWSKYQMSKAIVEADKMAIPVAGQTDRKFGYMTFMDSEHPEDKERFKMTIPNLKPNASVQALGAAIATLGLQYRLSDGVTVRNLDTYIEPGTGRIIDVFAGDTTQTNETPA